MQLSSQITMQFALESETAQKLFLETDNFHDSDLNYVQSKTSSDLNIGIRMLRWSFLHNSHEVDQLSTLHFKLSNPVYDQRWGNDEQICKCIIYDFLMQGDSFNLLTGDGGRAGTFSSAGSYLKFVTTPEILEHLRLA
jgi:hypothetical protein